MSNEKVRQSHLAEAKKAEEMAAKASTPSEAEKWLRIAKVFREIAEEVSE